MIDLTKLGRVTSPFGTRKAPTKGASSEHMGIDLFLPGYDIPNVFEGQVVNKGYNNARGHFVTIKNRDGYEATYQHMATPSPFDRGEVVSMGSVLGRMGSSGVSTGDHLHFEVKRNGTYIDPKKFFAGDTEKVTPGFSRLKMETGSPAGDGDYSLPSAGSWFTKLLAAFNIPDPEEIGAGLLTFLFLALAGFLAYKFFMGSLQLPN